MAEVLIDLELPGEAVVDLTIVDLTDPTDTVDSGPLTDGGGSGWVLDDPTDIGRVVTPDHVLAARSAYRRVSDGRPLAGSAGTFYQTVAGLVDEYVSDELLDDHAPATTRRDVRSRLEYFLQLHDDDFLACFRFNGDVTGEYLTHVERCERQRAEVTRAATGRSPVPSPGERRRRKAQSLRSI